MSYTLGVNLTDTDWDEGLRGWRCSALRLPGAVVGDLFVGGTRADRARYEVLKDHQVIRWLDDSRPSGVIASIELSKELSPRRERDRWRKLAVILPAVTTILATVITVLATRTETRSGGQASIVPPDQPIVQPCEPRMAGEPLGYEAIVDLRKGPRESEKKKAFRNQFLNDIVTIGAIDVPVTGDRETTGRIVLEQMESFFFQGESGVMKLQKVPLNAGAQHIHAASGGNRDGRVMQSTRWIILHNSTMGYRIVTESEWRDSVQSWVLSGVLEGDVAYIIGVYPEAKTFADGGEEIQIKVRDYAGCVKRLYLGIGGRLVDVSLKWFFELRISKGFEFWPFKDYSALPDAGVRVMSSFQEVMEAFADDALWASWKQDLSGRELARALWNEISTVPTRWQWSGAMMSNVTSDVLVLASGRNELGPNTELGTE